MSGKLPLVTQGTARSGDLSIAYSVQGNGPETVLLIIGLGCRSADWGTDFPARLAERYRVVQFDNRGTGASTTPDCTFTLEDMAKDALAVLDAVSAESVHLVGYSMGGMISQLLALEHAERFRRLVLVSTHFGGPRVVPPTSDAIALFQPGRGATPEQITRQAAFVLTAPGFADGNAGVVDTLVELAEKQPTSRLAFGAQVQAILSSDRADRVRTIGLPTLIIHGDSDALVPDANGRALAELIPGAKLKILEHCGHMPMWEKPAELAQEILGFLTES